MKKYKYRWVLRERITPNGWRKHRHHDDYPATFAEGLANTRKEARQEAEKHRGSHRQVIDIYKN